MSDHREHKPDKFAIWIYEHPWTMCYVAFCVTVLLILNIVQLALH
jgi:hypothetical protein